MITIIMLLLFGIMGVIFGIMGSISALWPVLVIGFVVWIITRLLKK